MTRRFLITGGAGYVGSHVVAALVERGETVVVLDNLRTAHRGAVPPRVELVEADLADTAAVEALLGDGSWHAVFHFASLTQVGESMRLPFRYLIDNGVNGMRLIEACLRHGVSRFVLSSTTARTALPWWCRSRKTRHWIRSHRMATASGSSSARFGCAERVHGLSYASLRYFNAAGTDPAGRFGEDHRPESHLVPLVIDAALGRRPELEVYGNDYATPDGTCLRDYVHVTSVARGTPQRLWQLRDDGAAT
jgi:UDP-glucose 4-epimerase